MNSCNLGLAIACFVLSVFLFRNKTKGFNENQTNYSLKTLCEECQKLFKIKLLLKFCFLIALGRGTILVFFTNFIIFYKKMNFHQKQGAFVLEGFIFFGLIGSFLFNTFLYKKNNLKLHLILFSLGGLSLLVLSYFLYQYEYHDFMKWSFMLAGLFLMNKIPLIFSLTIQNIPTSNVNLLNIILFLSSQIFYIIAQTALGVLMKKANGGYYFLFFLIGVYSTILLFLFIFKLEKAPAN